MSHGLRWPSELDVNKTTARISASNQPRLTDKAEVKADMVRVIQEFIQQSLSGSTESRRAPPHGAGITEKLCKQPALQAAGVAPGPLTSMPASCRPTTLTSLDVRQDGPAPNWTGCAIPKAAGKYHNVKTNGYASKRESDRAFQLKLMQEAGQIRDLREQVDFVLIPKQDGELACIYRADFVYDEPYFKESAAMYGRVRDGGMWREVIEDCKGIRTDVYRIKRKLMQLVYGIQIRET
jgi:hypothetical protein